MLMLITSTVHQQQLAYHEGISALFLQGIKQHLATLHRIESRRHMSNLWSINRHLLWRCKEFLSSMHQQWCKFQDGMLLRLWDDRQGPWVFSIFCRLHLTPVHVSKLQRSSSKIAKMLRQPVLTSASSIFSSPMQLFSAKLPCHHWKHHAPSASKPHAYSRSSNAKDSASIQTGYIHLPSKPQCGSSSRN